MQSTSQSAGFNSLVAAEASSSNNQKNSLLNPALGDKSLNTKEFSEVFDDQQAREKVAASSKMSDAGSDALTADNADLNKAAAQATGYTAAFAADIGKGLPPEALALPLEEGVATTYVATEYGQVSVIAAAFTGSENSATTGSVPAALAATPTTALSALADSDQQATVTFTGIDAAQSAPLAIAAEASTIVTSAVSGLDSASAKAGLVATGGDATAEFSANKQQALPQAANGSQATLANSDGNLLSAPAAGLSATVETNPVLGQAKPDTATSAAVNTTPFAATMKAMESLVEASRLAKGQVTQRLEASDALTASSSTTSVNTSSLSAAEAYKTAAQTAVATNAALEPGKAGFSEAVMQRVMWMSSQQINRADIALDPPELGSLQVRVSTQSEHTSVVFSSPHSAVREVLDQNLPRLREMLEQQGLNLADADVSDQSANQQQHAEQSAAGSTLADSEEGDNNAAVAASAASEQADPLQRSLQLVDHYV
jgi:flagellar hook-length control protein FliK